MLFTDREVRIEKNAASVRTFKTEGNVFLDTDRPRPVNNTNHYFSPEICLTVIPGLQLTQSAREAFIFGFANDRCNKKNKNYTFKSQSRTEHEN